LNVVDSSGWLEYFVDGPNAKFFAAPIESTTELIVPAITVYEVYKRTTQLRGRDSAVRVAVAMQRGMVTDLTADLAIASAEVSIGEGLALADSIILATARAYGAPLWTQDADFAKIGGVKYVARRLAP
jgi:predicted nucleic acid-binding protein